MKSNHKLVNIVLRASRGAISGRCLRYLLFIGITSGLGFSLKAQTLDLSFSFGDSAGTTTADAVVQAVCNMTNYNKVLADLHGASGTGPGKQGKSLDFTTADGANSANSVSSGSTTASVSDYGDSKINLGTVSAYTVAFWFKPAVTLGSGYSPQLFVLAPGSNARSTLLQGGANTLGFNINTSGNPQFWAGATTIPNPVASSTLVANIWYFYALTYDGAHYYVYVGNETNAVTCVYTNTTASATLALGSSGTIVFGDRASDNTRNFPGWLARFQFYTGAGTPSFVDGLRQAGLPLSVGTTTFSPASPVYMGTPVILSATVTNGITPYNYQWQVNAGSGFVNLSGATSNNYVLNTAALGGTTYPYQLVVADSESPVVIVTNTPATLLVSTTPLPPTVVSNTTISPASVLLGGTATLSAIISGTAPMSYQWQFSPTNTGGGLVNLPGATNATYVLTNAQYANAGYYWLTATNATGGTNTSFALLAVRTPVVVNVGAAGVDSSLVIGTLGSGAYDIAQLSSTGDTKFPDANGLNYYDNNATPPGQTFTTGPNSAGYTLGDLYYLCGGPSVSDGSHSAGVTYTLRLYSLTNAYVGTATLISTYTNQNTVPAIPNNVWVQWTGLTNVLNSNSVYAYSILAGSGYMHLGNSTNSPAPYSGGQLALFPTATGTPAYGSGTPSNSSATFLLDVVPNGYPDAESISMVPTNGSTLYAGTPITFTVSAIGTNIGYVWQLDNSALPTSNVPTYVLNSMSVTPGTHTVNVLVTNAFDTATSVSVSFTVVPATIQSVSLAPANSATNPVYAGTPVTLSASVQGNNVTYLWQTDNGNGNWTTMADSNTNAFTFSTAGLSAGTYQYDLIASNASGSVTSSQLTLNLAGPSAPVLVSGAKASPSVVMVGGSAQLTATFVGSQPMTYQWYFTPNGGASTPIAAATNTSFTLSNVQLTNAGLYYLAAANHPPGLGAQVVNSASALLYVVNGAQTNTSTAVVYDGGTSPFTGLYDVANLNYNSGLLETSTGEPVNAYVDAGTPVGQIFLTGSTPPAGYGGYPLNYVYFKEDPSGSTSGFSGAMGYILNVYQMLDGTNAALLTSYATSNTTTLASGDWIYIAGLTNILMPNASYCLSLHKNTTSTYWWKFDGAVEASLDSVFPSSQTLVAVPATGGAVTFSSPDPAYGYYYNTAFVAGMTPAIAPVVITDTVISPASVYPGQGPVTMTAAFNGKQPIHYQWQFTDANNNTSLIPGATNSTYTIALAAPTNAGSYCLLASNSVSAAVYVASTPTALNVMAVPDSFVMNFSKPSYSGSGVAGAGSAWNRITGGVSATENGASGTLEQSTVSTSTLDDGATLMPIRFSTFETWEFTHGSGLALLDNYMLLQGQDSASLFPFTFSNCIAGVYNLVLFGNNGSYGGGRTVFVVNGVSQTNLNSGNDTTFVQGVNYAAFYGVAVTNTLTGYWSQIGSGTEAGFNGAQLVLAYPSANPHLSIMVQPVGVTVPLNYAASLAVQAVGPGTNWLPGPLFYQWWNADTGTRIVGATNSSYTANTSIAGSTSFYAVITNLTGLATNTDTAVVTVYVPDSLRWIGSAGPAWDVATANWFDLTSSSSGVVYADPDYVLFDDTAASFIVSNLVAVNPASVSVNNSAANPYVFTGTSAISGSGSLTKTGNGSLTISNNQAYAGGTFVNQGSLILARGGSAGSVLGALTVNPSGTVSLTAVDALGYSGNYVTTVNLLGGVLDNATTGNEAYNTSFSLMGGVLSSSGGGAYNFGATTAINSLATNIVSTISGRLALRASGLTITTAQGSVPNGIDLSITGAMLDSGGNTLTKSGNGTLSLSGTNTFNGDITISAGTLRIDGAGSLNSGNYTAEIHDNGNLLSYNSSAAQTLAVVSGTGALTLNGPGTLTLNSVNTYAGRTTVNGGTLAGIGTIAGALTVNSGGTLAPGYAGAGTLTVNGNITLNPGSTNVFAVNGSTPANVAIAAGGNVTYGGLLEIAPSGSFASGQSFPLFSGAGATSTSSFAAITGNPGNGLSFQFTNGVLTVVGGSTPFTGTIRFTGNPVIADSTLTFSASNSGAGTIYLLSSTNLALPVSQWTPIWTNALTGSGSFTTNLAHAVNASASRQFYIFSNTNN